MRIQSTLGVGDLLCATFMGGLADATRVRIVRLLVGGPRKVGEIVAHLRMSQSRVSDQLACLRWCGYVKAERRGRAAVYGLTDPRIRQILELAQAIVADKASDIATCAQLSTEELS